MSQPRRDFLKAVGLGGLGISVSGDDKKDQLDYVDWQAMRFTLANVFVDGKEVGCPIQASETSGWVRYIARKGKSPYDLSDSTNCYLLRNHCEVIKRVLKGRVEIRFIDKDIRGILLREQNECLNG